MGNLPFQIIIKDYGAFRDNELATKNEFKDVLISTEKLYIRKQVKQSKVLSSLIIYRALETYGHPSRGVKLIFTGGHISLAVVFKGPNVISTP